MPLRFLLFFAVVLALTAGMHWYVYRRLIRDTALPRRYRRAGLIVVIALWATLIGSGPLNWVLRSELLDTAEVVAWTWMGVLTYLVLALMAFGLARLAVSVVRRLNARLAAARAPVVKHRAHDLGAAAADPAPPVTPPGGTAAVRPEEPPSPERRVFLSRAIAGGALLASGGVSAFGVWRAYHEPVINDVVVKLPKLPRSLEGFSIVQVSDIHVGPLVQRRFMDEMVARCNALRPDLVAVTGDLVDGDVATLGHAVSALAELKSRHGTYFITGNHEYYSGPDEWSAMLTGIGVQVLRNRRVAVGDAGGSFDLVGVDDWMAPEGERYDLEAAMAGRDPDRAAVLLAHQPANFREAAKAGVGLQLSGHTHGGQMFPMTLLVGAQWEHVAGLYKEGDAHIYVNRGTGFWGPPMRVGSPPEITRIVLT